MSVWAVAMVKDEADIIGDNIEWLLSQVDSILVADNMSTDGTSDILHRLSSDNENLHVVLDDEFAYYQSDKMTSLFKKIYEIDPSVEWVVPFDGDEFWFSKNGTIKDTLNNLESDVLTAPVWHMVSNLDTSTDSPLSDISWRQENPERFPVVAFRYNSEAKIHMGNHGIDWPNARTNHGALEVRHYQYRSLEHFIHKVRTGKKVLEAANLDAGSGAHWRTYGAMSDQELQEIWNQWANESGLIFDPWVAS
jgi:hypothetical protein